MHNFDETPVVYFPPYEYALPNGLGMLADAGITPGSNPALEPAYAPAAGQHEVSHGS